MSDYITVAPLANSHSRFDMTLVLVVGLLLAIGAIMVFSASVGVQGGLEGGPGSYLEMFWLIGKHLASIVVGISVLVVTSYVDITIWRRLSKIFFFLGILFLTILLVPGIGREVNGSTRWLTMGPLGIQPSEFAKILVILYLADYLAGNNAKLKSFVVTIVRPAVPLALLTLLFLLQPDLGSAVVVLSVALGILFLSGVRLHYLAGAVVAVSTVVGVLTMISEYRLERLLCFQDPFADATGCGYQLVQALIAVGSGEWFGVGLGSSVQKLFYLPHANNDFLVAVIAEELGFLGIVILVALYGLLLWRIFMVAREALVRNDAFSTLVAQGVGLLVAMQMMVHLAVNFGVVPTKGLTMPLMSAGGSSMVATCFAIGLIFSIDRNNQRIRPLSP